MFEISCAPEIFQKVLGKILVKCDGVVIIDESSLKTNMSSKMTLVFRDSEKQRNARLQIYLMMWLLYGQKMKYK